MAARITDEAMTSTVTRHTAAADDEGGWTVSWLPGRTVSRSQAVTALTIAEAVVAHAGDLADSGSLWWLHVDGWAAELGITGPHAVAEASLSPEDHQVPRGDWPAAGVLPGGAAQPGAHSRQAAEDAHTCEECGHHAAEHSNIVSGECLADGCGCGRLRELRAVTAEASAAAGVTTREMLAEAGGMSDRERQWLLAYIAGSRPEVLGEALEARRTVSAAADALPRGDAGPADTSGGAP